jgi:hypothetical protein
MMLRWWFEFEQLKYQQEQRALRVVAVLVGVVAIILGMCLIAHGSEIDLSRIATLESSGNPLAWNKSEDSRGLYGIRVGGALADYNIYHRQRITPEELFDQTKNRQVAEWYLNVRIPQLLKHYRKPDTVRNRLIAYNAGISYVVSGKPIPAKCKTYVSRYFGG